MSEIDRVQSTTTFNEQNLLDGSFNNKGLMVGAEAGQHIGVTIGNMSTNQLIAKAIDDETTFDVKHLEVDKDGNVVDEDQEYNGGRDDVTSADDVTLTAKMLDKFYKFDTDKVTETDDFKGTDFTGDNATGTLDEDHAPTSADFAALNAFAKSAIKTVSQQRSDLGAVQNRLEHTIKNLDNVVENTTAAESQIRDTDMASEMVKYSNNNILMQAGQSMLAQANQTNQGVLSLLR